jgi:hypothetical protein
MPRLEYCFKGTMQATASSRVTAVARGLDAALARALVGAAD